MATPSSVVRSGIHERGGLNSSANLSSPSQCNPRATPLASLGQTSSISETKRSAACESPAFHEGAVMSRIHRVTSVDLRGFATLDAKKNHRFRTSQGEPQRGSFEARDVETRGRQRRRCAVRLNRSAAPRVIKASSTEAVMSVYAPLEGRISSRCFGSRAVALPHTKPRTREGASRLF